ncbi:MAG: sugar phosphate isomerase/epimerase [Acidimicrobiia bacterium]
MSAPAWAVEQGTTRGGDVATDARLAAGAGFAALGLTLDSLLAQGVEATGEILTEAGLDASGIQGLPDLLVDPDETRSTYVAALDAAATLGAAGCLVGTGPIDDRSVRAADAAVRARLAALGELAAARGTRLLLEPMHPILRAWNYVHTLAHAAELIDGLPGVGVALDVGHLWWDRHLLDDLTTCVDQIGIVQLTDVPWTALDGLRYERDRPGTGDVPLPRLLRALDDAAYGGPYEVEILLRMPRDERPQFLADVRAALDDAWATGSRAASMR